LTRVTGRRGTIQRLVCACSGLIDLTLEACGNLTELSIDGACLRRLALRCCHGLASVNVNSPELQTFEYRGAIPAEPPSPPFLTMHSLRKISFCTLDFCGVERAAEVFGLMELFAGVERLHLTSARLGSSFVSHDGVFPCFRRLRNLEITGMLPDYDDDASAAIWTVSRVLEQTPRLETLSLFFLPEPDPVKQSRSYYVEKEVLDASHKLRYNPYACLAMPPRDVEVPCCLRETTKEINLVHYQGSVAQRALAKFLLCNAPLVDEVCWKVARGPLSIQTKLMEEIRGWVMNKSANMMFI
jgi:hypothetical protein